MEKTLFDRVGLKRNVGWRTNTKKKGKKPPTLYANASDGQESGGLFFIE